MHSQAMDDVLDPVLQQFYTSSSSHSLTILKVPIITTSILDNSEFETKIKTGFDKSKSVEVLS